MKRLHSLNRRTALSTLAGFALTTGFATAQDFGGKPITILLGVGAGGSTDILARMLAARLGEALKTPVLVSNRPSAGQVVAIQALKSAPPDGTTLYLGTGSALGQGPAVRANLPYDPMRDFSYISLLANAPGVFVAADSVPANTLAEFIQYAKRNPGKLNYGSAGVGTAGHFHMELFKLLTGVDMVHIPGKSDATTSVELLAGRVHAAIFTAQFGTPLIQAGRVKALMTTTRDPIPSLPKVPALQVAGVPGLEGLDPLTYFGLVGPSGMAPALVARLNAAINEIWQKPDVALSIRNMVLEPLSGSPDAFRALVAAEISKWRDIGKGIKFE